MVSYINVRTHALPLRHSIQRSLSAVQTLGGGNSSSSLVPPTLNASNSDLPPLSELSPSGLWADWGSGREKGIEARCGHNVSPLKF